MDEEKPSHRHPTVRERIDAARVAAEEVVAEESGQLGGEVSALAVPFEEIVAAVNAAIHPDRSACGEDEAEDTAAPDAGAPRHEPQPPAEPAPRA